MSAQSDQPLFDRADIDDISVIRFSMVKLRQDDEIHAVFDPLNRAVDQEGRRKFVLNLSVPEYLTSNAIGKLVALNKKVQATCGRLVLCHIAPLLAKLFENTRLDEVFTIYATEEEALQSFCFLARDDLDDVTVLRLLPSSLKEQDLSYVFEELRRLVTDSGRHKLVLNFHKVGPLSLGAMASLMNLARTKVLAVGGQLALCQVVQQSHQGLARPYFEEYADEEEAVQSLQ